MARRQSPSEMSLEYWYLFPISVVIATIAIASGVEGGTFFAPLFLLGLKLPMNVAIGAGLISQAFGFSSGLYAYVKKGLIDYQLGRMLLFYSLPSTLVGTAITGMVPASWLKASLSIGLLAIAISFLRSRKQNSMASLENTWETQDPKKCLTANTGETFYYRIRDRALGKLLVSLGGLLMGMISTGLGQLNVFFLIRRCQIPSKVAVATSVFIITITALIASVGHVIKFTQAGEETVKTVFSIVIFTAPGVLMGANLGSTLASHLSQNQLEKSLGVIFLFVSVLLWIQLIISNH